MTEPVLIRLEKAAIAGKDFPANVPDTAANRKLFKRIRNEIADMPRGMIPEIPADYTTW